MSSEQRNPPDACLVARCVAGDEAAWKKLFSEQHAGLLGAVTRLLGAGRRNEELAEEIAARVWYSLTDVTSGRLRAYDPLRGRLSTFLASLARQELLLHYRCKSPECVRSTPALKACANAPLDLYFVSGVFIAEFLPTLSGRERAFFAEQLGLEDTRQRSTLSAANRRKLKQRVLKKLIVFLSNG